MLTINELYRNTAHLVTFLDRGKLVASVDDWAQRFIPVGLNVVPCHRSLFDFMDNVHEHFGMEVKVNSGYRTCAMNERCGGADQSGHLIGFASDIGIHRESVTELYMFGLDHFVPGIIAHETFVHFDFLPRLFHQDLRTGEYSTTKS